MKRASDHGCRLSCLLMQEHKKGKKTFGQTVEILITFHCFTALVPTLHNQQVLKVLQVGGKGEVAERRGSEGFFCTVEAVLFAGCVFLATEISDRQEVGG